MLGILSHFITLNICLLDVKQKRSVESWQDRWDDTKKKLKRASTRKRVTRDNITHLKKVTRERRMKWNLKKVQMYCGTSIRVNSLPIIYQSQSCLHKRAQLVISSVWAFIWYTMTDYRSGRDRRMERNRLNREMNYFTDKICSKTRINHALKLDISECLHTTSGLAHPDWKRQGSSWVNAGPGGDSSSAA